MLKKKDTPAALSLLRDLHTASFQARSAGLQTEFGEEKPTTVAQGASVLNAHLKGCGVCARPPFLERIRAQEKPHLLPVRKDCFPRGC